MSTLREIFSQRWSIRPPAQSIAEDSTCTSSLESEDDAGAAQSLCPVSPALSSPRDALRKRPRRCPSGELLKRSCTYNDPSCPAPLVGPLASSPADVCASIFSRMWLRLVMSYFSRSDSGNSNNGCIFHPDEWRSRTVDRRHLHVGVATRCEHKAFEGTDSDRWVAYFTNNSQLPHCAPTVCTFRFEDSTVAVRALMHFLMQAHPETDACLWIVAIALAQRWFDRLRRHADSQHCGAQSSRIVEVLPFYRRHEMRVLFLLFGTAWKLHSDYYLRTQDVIKLLPRLITAVPCDGGSACLTSRSVDSLLPATLRRQYPQIAERVALSLEAERRRSRQPLVSPPFDDHAAGCYEEALLADGLGWDLFVSSNTAVGTVRALCERSSESQWLLEYVVSCSNGRLWIL